MAFASKVVHRVAAKAQAASRIIQEQKGVGAAVGIMAPATFALGYRHVDDLVVNFIVTVKAEFPLWGG